MFLNQNWQSKLMIDKRSRIRLIDNIPCYMTDIVTSDSRYIINLKTGKSKFVKEFRNKINK